MVGRDKVRWEGAEEREGSHPPGTQPLSEQSWFQPALAAATYSLGDLGKFPDLSGLRFASRKHTDHFEHRETNGQTWELVLQGPNRALGGYELPNPSLCHPNMSFKEQPWDSDHFRDLFSGQEGYFWCFPIWCLVSVLLWASCSWLCFSGWLPLLFKA